MYDFNTCMIHVNMEYKLMYSLEKYSVTFVYIMVYCEPWNNYVYMYLIRCVPIVMLNMLFSNKNL